MRRERVPQRVARDSLLNSNRLRSTFDRVVVDCTMKMMASPHSSLWINGCLTRREHPKPFERFRSSPEFPRQGTRDVDTGKTCFPVFLPDDPRRLDLPGQLLQ
tara:strand:- start:646 stop:954 length:309 start_codon:yes stop_codon:yes gene_type:complete